MSRRGGNPDEQQFEWWERGIVYEAYLRSFQDTNGDGVGDLPGIQQRLDYLKWLGVNVLWITPFYPSPNAEFGYDISDFKAVDPKMGTMADFDAILDRAHQLGMKVLIDLIPNHTSDQHPWFVKSRGSRRNAKEDWYLWVDPAPDGCPPNNWLSLFGGSAWEFVPERGQYYHHAFLKQQPDLNWRNTDVQEAIFDVMRFWLERGVDGFRVDALWHLIKDRELRDNPPNPDYDPQNDPVYDSLLPIYSTDQPEVHHIVARMRRILDEYRGRMMIGEVWLPLEKCIEYYGQHGGATLMPHNFQLILADWDARILSRLIDRYMRAIPEFGWPNWVLGNHDKPRVRSRVGEEQVRNAAMLTLTLRGTPTLYYGDEIGMRNVPIPEDRIQDPFEKREPGRGNGRDPNRTPMQWDDSRHAGFTEGEPWLPLAEDATESNVEAQVADSGSILSFYRNLIRLRQSEDALAIGSFEQLEAPDEILAYKRRHGESQFIIVLNFAHEEAVFAGSDVEEGRWRVAISTRCDRTDERVAGELRLRADEGVVLARE